MSEKRKRDTLPVKPPSVYWHMVSWGAVSGYFLAWGFLIFLGRLSGSTLTIADILLALIQGVFVLGFFGAIPGIIMGTLMGAYIKNRLKKRSTAYVFEDITLSDSQLKRRDFATVFLIAFILMSLLMLGVISAVQAAFGGGGNRSLLDWLFTFTPPLIAGTAATYAAQRYIERLRRWAKSAHENTEKAKHDVQTARLVDSTQSAKIVEREIMPQMSASQEAKQQ